MLLLVDLLRIVGAALRALHRNEVKLHFALLHAVVAKDVRVEVCILLWHWLLGHHGVKMGLKRKGIVEGLAAHRAVYVVPLIIPEALTMHGMAAPQEIRGVTRREEFVHAHGAVLVQSIVLALVVALERDGHAAAAGVTMESELTPADSMILMKQSSQPTCRCRISRSGRSSCVPSRRPIACRRGRSSRQIGCRNSRSPSGPSECART